MTTSKHSTHADWFHHEELPYSGSSFDRIVRGYADVDHQGKTASVSSYHSQFAPNVVAKHFQNQGFQVHDNPETDKYMKYVRQNYPYSEASYLVLRAANGGDPFVILSEADPKDLVPSHPLDKALATPTGRRGFIQRTAGAIAANPIARAVAVQAGTQAVVQGAQTVAKNLVPSRPSLPSHIEHPQAGVEGALIPHQELTAHATNLFAKEHGSDFKVEPHETPSLYRYHGAVTTPKKFDWKKYGDHSEDLYRARRETRIDEPLKLLGWESSGKISYDHHVAMTPTHDILAGHKYREDSSGGRFGGEPRHDEPGWKFYEHPNASHDRIQVHNDGTWIRRWETHGDNGPDWHEEYGQDKLSLAKHLDTFRGEGVPTHVEHFTHHDRPNTRYTKYHLNVAPSPEQGRGPATHYWDRHKKNDDGSWNVNRMPSYEGSPFHGELSDQTTTAWENAKNSKEFKAHQEDHSKFLTFTGKEKGYGKAVSNPSHPDYDHDAFMKEQQSLTGGVYVVENPYHWDNLKPHENSPHDKRGFDAMHVSNNGKVTRFHVPVDMSDERNSHVNDGYHETSTHETGLSHSQRDLIQKKTQERHLATQGIQWKHYRTALQSAMPGAEWSHDDEMKKANDRLDWRGTDSEPLHIEKPATITHAKSSEEHYETPSGDYRRRTVYTPHSSGLQITFHPEGKWQIHKHGSLKGEGSSPSDLRKALRQSTNESYLVLVANGRDPFKILEGRITK